MNPGHQHCQMALRFTHGNPSPDDAFPLRLRILREAQLAQVLIAHAESHPLRAETFRQRLALLQNLRQPQMTAAVSAEEIVSAVRYWQSLVPAAQQEVSDSEWYSFVELLPSLDPNARTRAWSLLWGDRPELTHQWQTLSHALHLLGHADEIFAPLSLLVDTFLLPAEGFFIRWKRRRSLGSCTTTRPTNRQSFSCYAGAPDLRVGFIQPIRSARRCRYP